MQLSLFVLSELYFQINTATQLGNLAIQLPGLWPGFLHVNEKKSRDFFCFDANFSLKNKWRFLD